MNKRFADTFFFIALLDAGDEDHPRAVQFASQKNYAIVTTRWVLAETANSLSTSADRAQVGAFLRDLGCDPRVEIIADSDSLFHRGLELYSNRDDKSWSLTDCISFVVMEQHGLTEALTADHHFEQAGYRALLK
jgi:predicted nucleic acid-binding protein